MRRAGRRWTQFATTATPPDGNGDAASALSHLRIRMSSSIRSAVLFAGDGKEQGGSSAKEVRGPAERRGAGGAVGGGQKVQGSQPEGATCPNSLEGRRR